MCNRLNTLDEKRQSFDGKLSGRETDALINHAKKMRDAMQEFVNRVDAGEVRSFKTYRKFKAILGNYEKGDRNG